MQNDLIQVAKNYKKIAVANLLKDIKNKSKKLSKLKSKDNLDKLIGFGQLLLQAGDQTRALQTFFQILDLEPEHFLALTYAAAVLEDLNQHQQALGLYSKAFENQQNNLNLASRIAWCQFKVGQSQSALGLMEKLINLKPDNASFYQMTAEMLFHLGQDALAKELILGFISRIFDEGLCFLLAKHFFEVNDFASAVDLFESINQQFPRNPTYQAHLAYALASDHQYEESRKWSLRALRKDDQQIKAWNALGFYYFSLKANFSKAKKYYQKVIDIDPNDVECLVNVGFMAQKQREFDVAKEIYEKVLTLEPTNREIKENLSLIYREQCLYRRYFELFEFRNRTLSNPLSHCADQVWDGVESLTNKKLLVVDEQGIGDLYSESWYFKLLQDEFLEVSVLVDQRAVPIFQSSFPDLSVYSAADEASIKTIEFDRIVFRSSLGLLFWETYYKIALNGYLHSKKGSLFYSYSWLRAPHSSQEVVTRLEGVQSIGFSWRSGLQILGRGSHYFSVEEFATILKSLPTKYRFVNLQYSCEDSEIESLKAQLGDRVVFPTFDLKDDQSSLACQMTQLDGVIGTCNAVLALATMLGKPSIWVEPVEGEGGVADQVMLPSTISQTKMNFNMNQSCSNQKLEALLDEKVQSQQMDIAEFLDLSIENLFEDFGNDYYETLKDNFLLESIFRTNETVEQLINRYDGRVFWFLVHKSCLHDNNSLDSLLEQAGSMQIAHKLSSFCEKFSDDPQWQFNGEKQVIKDAFNFVIREKVPLDQFPLLLRWVIGNNGLSRCNQNKSGDIQLDKVKQKIKRIDGYCDFIFSKNYLVKTNQTDLLEFLPNIRSDDFDIEQVATPCFDFLKYSIGNMVLEQNAEVENSEEEECAVALGLGDYLVEQLGNSALGNQKILVINSDKTEEKLFANQIDLRFLEANPSLNDSNQKRVKQQIAKKQKIKDVHIEYIYKESETYHSLISNPSGLQEYEVVMGRYCDLLVTAASLGVLSMALVKSFMLAGYDGQNQHSTLESLFYLNINGRSDKWYMSFIDCLMSVVSLPDQTEATELLKAKLNEIDYKRLFFEMN